MREMYCRQPSNNIQSVLLAIRTSAERQNLHPATVRVRYNHDQSGRLLQIRSCAYKTPQDGSRVDIFSSDEDLFANEIDDPGGSNRQSTNEFSGWNVHFRLFNGKSLEYRGWACSFLRQISMDCR